MSENKKRWAVIHFPNGEFTGKMTIGIDGRYVMNAEMAKQIIDKTAKHFQLKIEEICGSQRDKHIVVPRQIAMYLLRSELHLSFPKIAGELGRKDHTTAIHSVEKIEKAIKLDYMIREQVNSIRERLYA